LLSTKEPVELLLDNSRGFVRVARSTLNRQRKLAGSAEHGVLSTQDRRHVPVFGTGVSNTSRSSQHQCCGWERIKNPPGSCAYPKIAQAERPTRTAVRVDHLPSQRQVGRNVLLRTRTVRRSGRAHSERQPHRRLARIRLLIRKGSRIQPLHCSLRPQSPSRQPQPLRARFQKQSPCPRHRPAP